MTLALLYACGLCAASSAAWLLGGTLHQHRSPAPIAAVTLWALLAQVHVGLVVVRIAVHAYHDLPRVEFVTRVSQ